MYICAKSQIISYSSYYCTVCGTVHIFNASLPPCLPGQGLPWHSLKSTLWILSLTCLLLYLGAVWWRFVTVNVLSVCLCLHHLLLLCSFHLQRSLLWAGGEIWGSLIHLVQIITVTDGTGLTEPIRASQRPFESFLTCEVFEAFSTHEGSNYKQCCAICKGSKVPFPKEVLEFCNSRKVGFVCVLLWTLNIDPTPLSYRQVCKVIAPVTVSCVCRDRESWAEAKLPAHKLEPF